MRNIIPLKNTTGVDIVEFSSGLARPRTLTFSVTFQDGFLAHHWNGKPWNDFSLSVLIVSRLCLLVSSLIRVLGSVCQIRILCFSQMQRTHAHTHAHHVNARQVKTAWVFVDTRKVSSGNSSVIVTRRWFHSFLFLPLFFCQ